MKSRFRAGFLPAAFLLSASVANAQTIVTAIDGSQGWGPINRFLGSETIIGSQVIDATYARSGNGSIHIGGPAGSSLRNRVALINVNGFGMIGSLTNAGFDWYRSSSSTTGGIQSPALRLFINDNGTLSELIWEYTYNGPGNAPTDAWQSTDINLNSGSMWNFATGGYLNTACGRGTGTQLTTTIQGIINAGCLSSTAIVYGISIGLGGLPGTGSFDGALDNARLQFGTAPQQVWNFETATVVPEPSTYLLMAAGLAGLGFVARRRRA